MWRVGHRRESDGGTIAIPNTLQVTVGCMIMTTIESSLTWYPWRAVHGCIAILGVCI